MAANMCFSAVAPEVLTKDNYANWRACVKNYLVGQSLWHIVESGYNQENACGDEWRETQNAKALHAIQISCGPDMLSQIRECSSAKAAWDFLCKMNEPQSEGEVNIEPEKPPSQGESSSGDTSRSELGEVGEPKKPQSQEVSEPEEPQSHGESSLGMETSDYVPYLPLFKAVDSGNWEEAKRFLDDHPDAVRARFAKTGRTALHVAAISGHETIVKELVQLMSEQDLEIQTSNGTTALISAAAHSGNTQIARCMVEKNKKLVSIAAKNGTIPVLEAAIGGRKDVMRYLYSVTPLEDLTPEKGTNGAALLAYCITAKIFDVALDLLQRCPRLAFSLGNQGLSPVRELANLPSAFLSGCRLAFWKRWIYSCIRVQPVPCSNYIHVNIQEPHKGQADRENIVVRVFGQLHGLLSNLLKLFGIKQIYERKLIHVQALELLRLICEQIAPLSDPQLIECKVVDAIFDAARHGIVEFIMEIIKANSTFMSFVDKDGRDIFLWATIHRREKIFSLLHKFEAKKEALSSHPDKCGNNILHLAGMLAPSTRLDRISGAALQMQRELQWFKEVESIVPPKLKVVVNLDGKTPRETFTESHKELVKEGEKWMKEMATSCTFVAALIVTIMFAAAITIPGGYNGNTGFPLFLEEKLFMVFIVSDAISFFSSSTSVLIFLGILTSRYAEEYFLKSLPTKLILGLTTLFISIAAMMVTFCTALFVILQGQPSWIFVSIVLLAIVPITLFVLLQSPLLVEIFISTYGPSIFNREKKAFVLIK